MQKYFENELMITALVRQPRGGLGGEGVVEARDRSRRK